MSGRPRIVGSYAKLPEGAIFQDFEKEVTSARRKAGAKMIAKVKSRQVAKLKRSGASRRRAAAIRGITTAAGSVIMLDHAPLAQAQEAGRTITARAGYLTIGRAGQGLGKPGTRVPGGFTVQSKKGAILLYRRFGDKIEQIATLVKSVRIRKTLGFKEVVEAAIPDYLDEIDNFVYKGRR